MRLACGLIASVACVAPAFAQPTAKTQDEADAELRAMAEQAAVAPDETVIIFDERPDKPFDRDTDVRLTGEELAARGATDLASALRLLPEINVRDGGRGGFNIDIRGGRKGAVTVLVDGVSVTDPYYGTFDVSTIPITDIVQIRVSSNPASPIDGPGGPGGVIEVLTRDAIGPQVVVARLSGDSLPSFGVTGTARAALAKHLALRISASGQFGSRDHPLPGRATLDEGRHASTGASRLEYRKGDRRFVLDGFLDSRHYVPPPSDTDKAEIVLIDRETSARASAKLDDKIDKLQLQGQVWMHYLSRLTRWFSDAGLASQTQTENLKATRVGGMALATHPIGRDARWAASVNANREHARVVDHTGAAADDDVTMLEVAGDLQYERKRFRIDGAVGAAVPLGVDADPWPETKVVAKYRVSPALELSATGGYKGRLPSLRERFDPQSGNPSLDPEKTWHAEVRALEKIEDRLELEVAPFARRASGTIRMVSTPTPEDPNRRTSTNLDKVSFLGVDTRARVRVHRMVELGAAYNYIRARSNSENEDFAMTPLDRLPAHRVDGWARFVPQPRLSLLLRGRYFGESVDRAVDVPGYTTFEATASWAITNEYLAVLRVDDLTDVAPETRDNYHAPGRVISLIVQGTWE